MAVQVVVPLMGQENRPGVIAEWYKHDGADVHKGDLVYRFESDFVAFDVEAEADGILRHRLDIADAGQPGRVVAFILAPGETMPDPREVDERPAPAAEPAPEPPMDIARVLASPVPADEIEEPPADAEGAEWTQTMANWAQQHPSEKHLAQREREAQAEPGAPKPLPLIRRNRDAAEPAMDRSWGAVPGDEQDFADPWDHSKKPKKEVERDVFGYALDDEIEAPRSQGTGKTDVLGFPVDDRPALKRKATSSTKTDVLGFPTDEDDAPSAPDPALVSFRAPREFVDPPLYEGFPADPPVRLPSDPMPGEAADDAEEDGAYDDVVGEAFTAMASEEEDEFAPEPAAIAPVDAEEWEAAAYAPAPGAAYPPVVLTMKATIRMAEVRKMRDQLTREWRLHEIAPTDEDIVIRAFARAVKECPPVAKRGSDVGLVLLEEQGEGVAVLEGAAHGNFREQVAALAALRKAPQPRDCACTVTSFEAFGIEEGTPPLADGHPVALALGAARFLPEEGSLVPIPWVIAVLSYAPELVSMSQAAQLMARVRELIEAPYALLAD